MSNNTNPPLETRFQTPQHKDTIPRMPGTLLDSTQFHEEEGYMLLNPAPEFFLPSFMTPKASWGQALIQTFRRMLPYGRHVAQEKESLTADTLHEERQGKSALDFKQKDLPNNPMVAEDGRIPNGFFASSVKKTPDVDENGISAHCSSTSPVHNAANFDEKGSSPNFSIKNAPNVSHEGNTPNCIITTSADNVIKLDAESVNPFVAHVEPNLDPSTEMSIGDGLQGEIRSVELHESSIHNPNGDNLLGVTDMDIDPQHFQEPHHHNDLPQSLMPVTTSSNYNDKETATASPGTTTFPQPTNQEETDFRNMDATTNAFPKLKAALKSFDMHEEAVELVPIGTCDIQIDGCAFDGARFFKVDCRDVPNLGSTPDVKPFEPVRKGSPTSVNSLSTAKSAQKMGISKCANKTPGHVASTNARCKMTLRSARQTTPKVCEMTKMETLADSDTVSWASTANGEALIEERPSPKGVGSTDKFSIVDVEQSHSLCLDISTVDVEQSLSLCRDSSTVAAEQTPSLCRDISTSTVAAEQSPSLCRDISTVAAEQSPSLCRNNSACIKIEEGCNQGQPNILRSYKSLRIAKVPVPGAAEPQYLRTPPTSEPDLLQILQNRKMAAPLPRIPLPVVSRDDGPLKWPKLVFEIPGQPEDYFVFPLNAATIFTTGYNPHHMVLAYMLQYSSLNLNATTRGEPILLRLSRVSDTLWRALCDATQDTTIACSGMLGLTPENQHPLNNLAYAAACAAYTTPEASCNSFCHEPYVDPMDLHDDSEATETESWRGHPNDDSTATSRCNTPIRTEFSAAGSTSGSPTRRDTVSTTAVVAVNAGTAGAKGKQRGHVVRGNGNGNGRSHPYAPSEVLWCRSCGTSRTPLWRSGPQGPKTLCNACGVKWKAGKLDGADFTKPITISSNSPKTKRKGARSVTGKSSSSTSSPGQDPGLTPNAAPSAVLVINTTPQERETPGRYKLRCRSRSVTEEPSVSVTPAHPQPPPPLPSSSSSSSSSSNGRKRKMGGGEEGRKRSKQ